jgi:hypothetical protein
MALLLCAVGYPLVEGQLVLLEAAARGAHSLSAERWSEHVVGMLVLLGPWLVLAACFAVPGLHGVFRLASVREHPWRFAIAAAFGPIALFPAIIVAHVAPSVVGGIAIREALRWAWEISSTVVRANPVSFVASAALLSIATACVAWRGSHSGTPTDVLPVSETGSDG